MMTRGLVAILAGLFFACQSNMPALADDADVDAGFVVSAIGAHELHQIRGGMSVVPELSGIVVIAGVPPQARRGINKPDLIEGLAGVPEAARGISEALVTTAAGVKETIGRIAAVVQSARRTALQQGRVLLDSD